MPSTLPAPAAGSVVPVGNLGEVFSGLVGHLGIEPSATRDSVTEAILAALEARGHHAEIVELRYGTLTLRAAPLAARLLTYDRDQLLAALEKAAPGVVDRLRIRTR